MNWASGIVVYVILWWLLFFMALPFGVKSPHEAGEEAGPGFDAGAPLRTHLWLKVAATTVIAALLWAVAYWLITSDLISFRGG